MSKLNEKIAELVKGNKAIESYIEVTAMESTSQAKQEKLLEQLKSANDRLIDSWVKSGAFALSVDKELANIMKELKSEKEWSCPECGVVHDRDENAANNLQKMGQKYLLDAAKAAAVVVK